MKLYRKKLNGLEELKREKIRLRYERIHLQAKDLNPLSEWELGRITDKVKPGLLGTFMELISAHSPFQTAMALGKPLLRILSDRKAKKRQVRYVAGLPREKSIGKRIVSEIVINYVIGKAVQLSVAGIRSYLKKRKEKKWDRKFYK